MAGPKFPLPVDFPAIEVTLVAFVASVRNDAQSLAGHAPGFAEFSKIGNNWRRAPEG